VNPSSLLRHSPSFPYLKHASLFLWFKAFLILGKMCEIWMTSTWICGHMASWNWSMYALKCPQGLDICRVGINMIAKTLVGLLLIGGDLLKARKYVSLTCQGLINFLGAQENFYASSKWQCTGGKVHDEVIDIQHGRTQISLSRP